MCVVLRACFVQSIQNLCVSCFVSQEGIRGPCARWSVLWQVLYRWNSGQGRDILDQRKMDVLPVSRWRCVFLYCGAGTLNSLESYPSLMLARKGHEGADPFDALDLGGRELKFCICSVMWLAWWSRNASCISLNAIYEFDTLNRHYNSWMSSLA